MFRDEDEAQSLARDTSFWDINKWARLFETGFLDVDIHIIIAEGMVRVMNCFMLEMGSSHFVIQNPKQKYVEPIRKTNEQSGGNDAKSQFIEEATEANVITESAKRVLEKRKNQSLLLEIES
ncbi:unnamed protein product [Arabis nemorensis]|uniref:Uncharacterized protein n=1 Tax=Arabis nemorensis TaxID=586526 RepID=A0A565AWW0_9BRAS|nr:unnamed protein product [Arabis nemorensis]